ncbi:hypothetical protein K7472_13130 [Streptomyces sp. PTM05]|uniref:Uncharacterized protein n=1 Tax=Streptantibioticus parmotrematis TaxID=2873249 RepID=A0ABS7QRH4_9ACTN|nr:hypothetical protein [Streptantibioticus parmotrematis]MBY8885789.1 hypothetical protein [Streptantibioticus parmotrematis]
MLGFIRPFLPWIAYSVVASALDWRWGALVGLLWTAGELLSARRSGRGWDSLVIEVCSSLYFVIVVAVAFAEPHSSARPYIQAASSLWLALAAWGSLAIRRPFTLGIAKQTVPAEFWNNPVFYRVNAVITSAWAISFTLSGAAMFALRATHGSDSLVTLVTIAGFVVPAVFTARYPAAARARAAAATQA